MKPMIIQKLKKDVYTDIELAEKYYSILSAINNLHLTEREIQLISFTAIKELFGLKRYALRI